MQFFGKFYLRNKRMIPYWPVNCYMIPISQGFIKVAVKDFRAKYCDLPRELTETAAVSVFGKRNICSYG